MDGIKELIEYLINLEGKTTNPFIYITLVLLELILISLRELVINKKPMTSILNDVIIQVVIAGLVGCLALHLMGPWVLPFAIGGGVVAAIFIYRKLTATLPEGDTEIPNPSKEIPSEQPAQFDKIDKDITSYDILDILYAYGYISEGHYKRVIEESIFETDADEIVDRLLKMPVVTNEQVKEARVIMNLIRLYGRVVSREEAVRYMIEHEDKLKGR